MTIRREVNSKTGEMEMRMMKGEITAIRYFVRS